MPTKPAPSPEPDPTPATDTTPTTTPTPAPAPAPGPSEPDTAAGRLPAGTYVFTGTLPTQYLDVPLTAHPADDNGRPATIFDWPFGAPADGRWEPTKKKPNQQPDNAPAHPEGE